MSNEYDFTQDDQTSVSWENADEGSIKNELAALSSRLMNLVELLEAMVYENDYDKTDDAYSYIWMNDLSASGFVTSFYNNNKDALKPYSGTSSIPGWYHEAAPERQKAFNAATRFFADFAILAKPFSDLRKVMMLYPLKTAFRFQRITLNFDEAGYGEELYHSMNKDVEEVSRIINQSWDRMERDATISARYYNEQGGKVSRSEFTQGYRRARLKDYEMIYSSSDIRRSFDMRSDGSFTVKPSMRTRAIIIDKYTRQISTLDNIEDDVKEAMKGCTEINTAIQVSYDKFKTQECRQLADAVSKVIQSLYDFSEGSLNVYTCYKEKDTDQPYLFERLLPAFSSMKSNYGFEPITADPWKDGTQYEKMYDRAASALSQHCRDFVYNHGHPELR